eukprot:g13215.t2
MKNSPLCRQALCQKFEVQGYPTIKFFFPEEERPPQNFRGHRSIEGFLRYARRMTSAPIRHMSLAELEEALKTESYSALLLLERHAESMLPVARRWMDRHVIAMAAELGQLLPQAVGNVPAEASLAVWELSGIVASVPPSSILEEQLWREVDNLLERTYAFRQKLWVGLRRASALIAEDWRYSGYCIGLAEDQVFSPARQQWPGQSGAVPAVAFFQGSMENTSAVDEWIAAHRFPGVWALQEQNFYEFTHSDRSAVLVAVAEATEALEAEVRGAQQRFAEHFVFGAMNGSHWAQETGGTESGSAMTTCMDLNAPYSRAELKRVKAVRFTMFDADTLQGYSVAEINKQEVYRDGVPVEGGVNDPRLGPIDVRSNCHTCEERVKTCPGHWGHITLAKPMYHWGFMKATHNVLRAVCYNCSKLLADPQDLKMKNAMDIKSRKKRLQAVMVCCRAKRVCNVKEEVEDPEGDGVQLRGGCGHVQPRYFIDSTELYQSFPEIEGEQATGTDRKRKMPAEEAKLIFERISDRV